jgi:hypothetical protein
MLNQKTQVRDSETGLILSDELYTPEHIIRAVRDFYVIGPNIDPCTSEEANLKYIGATYIGTYTKPLDYSKIPDITKSLWLNPPYSRASGGALPHVKAAIEWWDKQEGRECLILLRQDSSTKVAKLLTSHFAAKCDLKERPIFWGPGDKGIKGQSAYTLWYLGQDIERFIDICATYDLGKVWVIIQ